MDVQAPPAPDPDENPARSKDSTSFAGALGAHTILPGNPLLKGKLPDRIGKFEIRDLIGEGGMGVVGLGVESEGHAERRRVAIKLLKLDVKGGSFEARIFEQECQSLARFNHDNIARLFDFGYHEGNQRLPFIVMEYVEHAALITDHCAGARRGEKQAPIPLRERLELFLRACDGVRHAHERNVIHRDISAKNVLVGKVGGKPVVKIIDFGISLHDEDKGSREGGTAGTPAYMSPEQLADNPALVDQRSDVYALGILLCELMVGQRPYEFETTEQAKTTLDAMGREGTRAVVPSRLAKELSTRRNPGDATAPDGSFWRRLAKELRGDLDAIVARATTLSPEDRYRSVAELVEDIESYLRCFPLKHAIQPSPMIRVTKFLRRNAAGVAAAAMIALLLAGLVTYVVHDLRKTRANNRTLETTNAELRQAEIHLSNQVEWLASEKQRSYATTLAKFPVLLNQGRISEARTVLAGTRNSHDRGWEWYHLLAASDQSRMVLGYSPVGFTRAFITDSAICAIDGENSVWFWKSDSGAFLKANSRHRAAVLSGAVGKQFCHTLDARGTLASWMPETGAFKGQLNLKISGQTGSAEGDILEAAFDAGAEKIAARWRSGRGALMGLFNVADGSLAAKPVEVAVKGSLCWRRDGTVQTAEFVETNDDAQTVYHIWKAGSQDQQLQKIEESPLRTDGEINKGFPVEMISRGDREFLRFKNGLALARWTEGKLSRISGTAGAFDALAAAQDGASGVLALEGGSVYRFACQGDELTVQEAGTTGNIGRLIGHSGAISSLSLSADGRRFLSASADGSVRVWDLTPTCGSRLVSLRELVLERLRKAQPEVQVAIFAPLLQRLTSGKIGWSRAIRHTDGMGTIAVFNSPPWILRTGCGMTAVETCSPSEGFKLPAFLTTKENATLNDAPEIVGAGASVDGSFIALLRFSPGTSKVDLAAGDLLKEPPTTWISAPFERPNVDCLAVSDDRRWVALNRQSSSDDAEELLLYSFRSSPPQEILLKPQGAPLGAVSAIKFSASGKWLAVGNATGQLFLWGVADGQLPTEAQAATFDASVRAIAFSADDQRVAIALAKASGPEGVFDSAKLALTALSADGFAGRPVFPNEPQALGKFSRDLCWSPNGMRLASADTDGRLRIWAFRPKDQKSNEPSPQLSSCNLALELEDAYSDEAGAPLHSVSWSPDGRWMVSSNAREGCFIYQGAEDDADALRRKVQLELDDARNRVSSIEQLRYGWRNIAELNALPKQAVEAAVTRIGVHPAGVAQWVIAALARMGQRESKELPEERQREFEVFLKPLETIADEERSPRVNCALALAHYRLHRYDSARQALKLVGKEEENLRELLAALIDARTGNFSGASRLLGEQRTGRNEEILLTPLWDELSQLVGGSKP